MTDYVLDSSALLAAIQDEPGGPLVAGVSGDSAISSVNLTETVTRLIDLNHSEDDIKEMIEGYTFEIVSYDEGQCWRAGLMRLQTKQLGLSLGDRACLALAITLGVPVLTADRIWATLDLGIEVRLIR